MSLSVSEVTEVPELQTMDDELWTDYLGDYIAMWLENSKEFIQDQQEKLLKMALCPFLYGVHDNLPDVWNRILFNNGVLEKEREGKITPLSESELETLEMAEVIFLRCCQLVENKVDLKTILNFIYEVEERSTNGYIDMNFALHEVANQEVFKSMWAPLRKTYEHKKKQAHVCIIYFFKTIHQHVVFYGRDGLDKADFTIKHLTDKCKLKKEDTIEKITGVQGNLAYKEGNYKQALELYTSALEIDPLNSQLYSNRAKTQLLLKNYNAALCDSKRAIVLDRSSFKDYFRAAELYLELDQLDKAEELNKMALKYANDSQREYHKQQSQDIEEAKKKKFKARSKDRDSISCDRMEEKENEPPENHSPVQEYNKHLSKGSYAYHSMKYINAAEFFHNALDLISKHGKEVLNVREEDLNLLNFVYAMACIHTPSIHNLQNAIDRFVSIGQGDLFPPACYGLGLAFLTLHRYKDAIDHLTRGSESVTNYEGNMGYLWPQTNRPIDETDPKILKNLLTEKLKQCKTPARPDAFCTFHLDAEITRREIYKMIPDYKGSITLKCSAKCVLEFHMTCWKLYKQNVADKHSDKEMLDLRCPTPCCWGFTCTVIINKLGQEPKHFLSTSNEKPIHIPRPMIKTKTDNPQKLLKRAQKKKERKEKKNERKLLAAQKEAASNDQADADVPIKHVSTEDQTNLHRPDCQVTILKKDEPDLVVGTKQKSTKVKKKKEKVKHFLTVDVQFKDDQDRKRVSAFTMDEGEEGGDQAKDGTVSSGSVSGNLPLPGVDLSTPGGQGAAHNRETLKELFLFFGQIVKSERILDLNGPLVRDALRSLPAEAIQHIDSLGGIAGFLGSNPNFNILRNNFVNLSSAADKPAATQSNPGLSKPATLQQPNPAPSKPQFSWENRKKLMEAAAAVAAKSRSEQPGQNVWNLNPAAKEFFPPATNQSGKGGYNELDSFELPKSALKSTENDPPSAASSGTDNDGFRKVTSKKSSSQPPRAGVIDCSAYDFFDGSSASGQRSSYDTLDAITLNEPKKSKASSIDMLDEDDVASSQSDRISLARSMESDDRSDQYSSNQGRRENKSVPDLSFDLRRQKFQVPPVLTVSRRSSDASDVSGEGSGSQASSITSSCSTDRRSRDQAAAPMPLKASMINLPSRGKKKGVRPLLANCYRPVSVVLGQKRTPSADSSVTTSSAAADDDDLESLASTHSDLASDYARQSPGLVSVPRSNTASSASVFTKPRVADLAYQPGMFSYETSTPKASETRKVVNRNLFDSDSSNSTPTPFPDVLRDGGSQLLREQPLPQVNIEPQASLDHNPFPLYRDSFSSDRSLSGGMWSGADDQLKDFFPSFSHKTCVPDMKDMPSVDADSLRVRQSSESRVLKQLASRTNLSSQEAFSLPVTTNTLSNHESVYKNIWKAAESDSSPKTPTWNTDLSGGLSEFNLGSSERGTADPGMGRCSSTPHDPMDRPVLACKGPWMPPPDIPITNSPLLQPSSIAPLDTSSIGWMLSGLKSSLDSPLTTSDMDLPQRDYQLKLDTTGFSRTPGKRNPFSMSSMKSDAISLSGDVFSSRAKLSAESEPFFPPSYLDQSYGPHGHSRLGFSDDFTQTTQARQVTEGSQTETPSVTELKIKKSLHEGENDLFTTRICQLELEKSAAVSRAESSERRQAGFELLYETTKQENEQLKEKLMGAERKNQSLERDFNLEKERRLSAERKVLTLAMELSLKTMEFKRVEASAHVQKLGAALKKINPSEDIYLDLQKKQGEWNDYMNICERKIEEIWATYQKKIKEFNLSGSVDDLELLSTVPPPSPSPPSLEKIQSSTLVIKSSPGSSIKDSEDDAQALMDMIYSGDGVDSRTTSPDSNNAHSGSNNGGHARGGGRKSPPTSSGSDSSRSSFGIIGGNQLSSDAYPAVKKGLLPTPLVAPIPKLMGNPFQKPVANFQSRPVAHPLLHKPADNSSRLSPKLGKQPLRNLNPIQPKGMPLRPLKPAVGALPRPAAAAVPPQLQTSFEKIVIAIQEMFPNYPRSQVQRVIDGLRKANGGSLSGFNEEILTRHIAERIIEEDGVEISGHTAFTPEELVTKKGPRSVTDSQCTICYEMISYTDAETLDCQHKFHPKCIKKWFAENRSCPNCRTFVLPQDEFPSLHQHRYL